MKTPQQQIAQFLIKNNLTLSTAESCTGGLLSHTLTNIPGCSCWFKGSIIAYANDIKINILKVPKKIIEHHGAVSKQAAALLAKNIKTLMKTSFGIGITGIAGPGGGTKEKPVGLVYIAIAHQKGTFVKKCLFHGSRLEIKKQTTQQALHLLIKHFK